jgi:hypothetical protein
VTWKTSEMLETHGAEIAYQPKSNSATSWTPTHGKTSMPHCTEKSWWHLSPPLVQLQTCLHINWQKEQVSTMQHAGLHYPLGSAQPLGRLIPHQQNWWTHSELYSNTNSRGSGWNTESVLDKGGWGKELNSQHWTLSK